MKQISPDACEPAEPRTSASSPLGELLLRRGQALLGFFRRRLRNEADAADAVQETSLRLLRYQSQPSLAAPEALMFRVAQSVVSDHFRQRTVRHAQDHVPIADLELVADLPTHEQTVSGEEELRLLVTAIQELKPKCRQAFLMSRLHGLTYPQIAESMGLSEQMVAKYISTALLHCRIKVEG
ncbi:MAG: sigma-70 family RNA polymerase sigma factor [Gammaproteobacteria bacterium]